MSGTSGAQARYLAALDEKAARMRRSWRRSFFVATALFAGAVGVASLIGEVGPLLSSVAEWVRSVFDARGWSPAVAQGVLFLAVAGALLMVMQVVPMFLVWWERKAAAHMQGRLGPMDVGGWHGWAQTIADGIKLFLKDTVEPDGVDRWVYRAAPVVVFVPAYLALAPLPFGAGVVGLSFDIGLLFVLAVSGLSTVGILMAGWGSANKYAVLGGLRAAAQMVSFEIPRVLSVVPVVMWAGTMSLTGIIDAQAGAVGGWVPRWFVFYPVIGQIAFVIYLITTIAETNRVPFDMPEAESELVAGFHTEYGGLKFGVLFMAEYGYVFIGSLLGAVLFFGGGAPPHPALGFLPSWAWLLAKTAGLMFLFLWARWTLPRLRGDRLMDLCWKFFLPWTLINLLLAGGVFLWRMG